MQRRSLSPHRISQSRHRLHIVRTVNREADRADLLSDSLGGAEESCRRMVGAGVAGQAGKAFEHVGEIQVCPASAAHASALCASRSASSRLPSATAILAQVASAIAR